MNKQEIKLLEGYRRLCPNDKKKVMAITEAIASEGEKGFILPSGLTMAQYEQVSNLREKIAAPSGAGNTRKPRRAVRGAKQSKGRGHGKK